MQEKRTVAVFRMQIECYLKENFSEQFCVGSFHIEHSGWLRVTAASQQTKKLLTIWYDRANGECRDSRLKELLPVYASNMIADVNEMWDHVFCELNTVFLFGRPNATWNPSVGIMENAEQQKARLVIRIYIREKQISKAVEAKKIEMVLKKLQCCAPQAEISFRYVSESDWQSKLQARQYGKNYEVDISNCEEFYYAQLSKEKALPSIRMIEEAMRKWQT